MRPFLLSVLVLGLFLVSCTNEPLAEHPAPVPAEMESVPAALETEDGPGDAGAQAWVKRVIPLLWGRHPLSLQEVHVLEEMTAQLGRSQMVRVMTRAPAYRLHWEQVFKDALAIHRLQFAANPGCYGRSHRPEVSTDVAEQVIEEAPDGAALKPAFTLRDLIHSALLLDDLTPIYTANLVAVLARAIDDMHQLASIAQRRNRAQSFLFHYMNRRMSCLGCHNSEYSVTADRTWPVGGFLEKAVLGASGGRDIMELIRFFRRKGVVAGYYYTHDPESEDAVLQSTEQAEAILPWGWHADCGRFFGPDNVRADDVNEWDSYFIESTESQASIWELERRLRAGFEKLRDGGASLVLDAEEVDGDVAFAWLVAMNITDQVWATAFGHRLTISNFFPRSPEQRDLLASLTQTFVDSGYSLSELLVAVTGHAYFNAIVPAQGGLDEPFSAVFDPFVQEDRPPAERRNHVGHTVFRADARVLLRSTFQALEWPELPEYLMYFMSPAARLQRSAGVFLKIGDSGFRGTSFQSALSWEAEFGLCGDRSQDPVCPFQPILDAPVDAGVEATVCELCQNAAVACDWDPRCCDVDWDAYCSDECETGDPESLELSAFPAPAPANESDWITRLYTYAESEESTLAQAVAALKDRLLTEPTLSDPEERAVLETLLGVALETPIREVTDGESVLRRACGVFLATPEFQLAGAVTPDVLPGAEGLVLPDSSYQAMCEDLASALFDPGVVQCGAHALKIQIDD